MPSHSPTPPTARRLIPVPVETTTWSSSKVRRFPVQPLETTVRSHHRQTEKDQPEVNDVKEKDSVSIPAPKRWIPVPVETSFHSNRVNKPANHLSTSPEPKISRPRQKFVPQLIEESRRTKKAGDSRPATLPTDKTDLTPGVSNIYTCPKNRKLRASVALTNPSDTLKKSGYSAHLLPFVPRRQGSMRPHFNTRQSSFTSSLEPISSSESNSASSSPSHSPVRTPYCSGSTISSEDPPNQLSRTRESCDDRFSGYLLALAAKAAEKQLREQALLAAFPNETNHEIVEHFYDREIEGASDNDSIKGPGALGIHEESRTEVATSRKAIMKRKSSESDWAIQEMQQHQDKCARLREEEKHKSEVVENPELLFSDTYWMKDVNLNAVGKIASTGKELEKMRNAASPPMLGTDLKFRSFPSPKGTKFESDQKINLKPNRCEDGGGLWGGYCVAQEPGEYLSQSLKGPSLIHTPMVGESFGDPFAEAFVGEVPETENKGSMSPKQPKSEVTRLRHLDEASEEFNDDFVTQVYNYLSLGYPSLARQFDDELSRISKVPVEELRLDDQMDAKGHIGLKQVGLVGRQRPSVESSCVPKNCAVADDPSKKGNRWHALKIYILEWGKQLPSLSQAAMGPSAWGVRARRGSWGI